MNTKSIDLFITNSEMMEQALLEMESHPEYLSKFLGNDDSPMEMSPIPVKKGKFRPCAWTRKRLHKKREWRKFLNINPGKTNNEYLPGHNMIYVFGGESDWKTRYALNPYNHRYLSKKGDVRVLRGKIQLDVGVIVTGSPCTVKEIRRMTNRYVRHLPVSDDNCCRYTYYKRRYKDRYDYD